MAAKAFAIIAGVGPGTGASVARRFASSYPVVLLARNPDNFNPLVKEINSSGGKAIGISTDVADAKSVSSAFDQISREFEGAGLAAAVFNVGGRFIRKPFLELTQDDFEAGYEANGTGAFLFSQATIPLLLKSTSLQYPPTLIFTGATASLKGSALCASFASGKFAMRALCQSLGREFGPKGVHVAHAIIDGVIDIPRTKEWKVSDAPDAKISANAIADAYWHLHTQPRSCFTSEIDLRPYVEKW
ncbi:MAG: hypothetical protein M1827_006139 [Pycnora praestabilis]|nr:MAG: hypothetical protein M1827_006139 [Pycnora praestabilis]